MIAMLLACIVINKADTTPVDTDVGQNVEMTESNSFVPEIVTAEIESYIGSQVASPIIGSMESQVIQSLNEISQQSNLYYNQFTAGLTESDAEAGNGGTCGLCDMYASSQISYTVNTEIRKGKLITRLDIGEFAA